MDANGVFLKGKDLIKTLLFKQFVSSLLWRTLLLH